jgi:hypothetical protein
MPQYMTGLRGPIPRRMTSGQGKQGKHVRSLSCLGTLTSKKKMAVILELYGPNLPCQ